jgi:predicted membrane GTPase involved in stress response
MQYNVLNQENVAAISAKAKTKNDGIFTMRGITYRVKNHHVTHYAVSGDILFVAGHFNYQVGSYMTAKEMKDKLRTIND